MSAWPDIDPSILRLIIDGGEELARVLWHAFAGDKKIDTDKLDEIRRRAQEAFIRKLQDELEQAAAVANLAVQLAKLGPMTESVLKAFDAADPRFPKINEILNIKEVSQDTELGPDGEFDSSENK